MKKIILKMMIFLVLYNKYWKRSLYTSICKEEMGKI